MFNFDEIKTAVEGQNQNESSLIALASYLYNIDFEADKSIKIYSDKGRFLVKEFGGKYADLMQAKDFAGLVRIATNGLKGQTLLAQKAHLLAVCCGINIGGVSSSAATCAAPKARPVQAKIANKKKVGGSAFTPYFAEWQSSYGDAVLAYFKTKIGGVDIDFLERYGVRPLLRFTMPNSEGGVNDYKELLGDKVTFSYTAGDWSKKIQPYQPKDKKTLTNAGANQYVFGLAQLPKSGENLFIFEGESDVLLAAKHGFSAICFGGITKPISDELAAELKARFPNIIVFFDNEIKAQKAADELAQKHGFRALDARFFFSYISAPLGLDAPKISDICDLLAAARARTGEELADKFLAGVLGEGLTLFGDKKAIRGDKFSIEVKNALKLNVNQYISEPAQGWTLPIIGITTAISQYKKVCLQAAAGAGKSHALAAIIPQLLEGSAGITRVVIAVPVTPLAKQLQASLEKNLGRGVLLISGDAIDAERYAAAAAGIIVTTYDSINICVINEYTLLVTDEAQQLISDFSYRPKATRALLEAMQKTPYNLLLSATPNHLFNAHFGFKLITTNVKITNKKSVDICYHNSKQKDLLAQIIDKAAAEKIADKTGAIMIKLDNSLTLRAAQKYAQSLGLTSEIFTSARREFKENSPNFQSLMQTGFLAKKVDIIFTTCLIEAGVSINNKVRAMYILDTLNVARLIQQISRPRYDAKTGDNDFLDVFIFVRTPQKDEPKQYSTAAAMLKKIEKATAEKAELLNAAKDARRAVSRYAKGDAKDYILEDENGFYSVDILQIFHNIEEKSNTKNYEILKARLLEDVTISSVKKSAGDADENPAFDFELDAMFSYRDAIRADVLNLIIANKKEDAEKLITYALTKERNVIERQVTARALNIGLDEQTLKEAAEFVASLPQKDKDLLDNEDSNIFDALQKTAKLTRAAAHSLNQSLTIVRDDIKDELKQAEIKAQAAVLADRRRRAKRDAKAPAGQKRELTAKEQNLADAANAVYKEFSNYIKGINAGRRAPFLIEELVTITNKVITAKDAKKGFKPKTAGGKESVIKFLEGFYTVTPVLAKDKKAGDKTRYILERLKVEK